MKEWKYLFAYIIPLVGFFSFYMLGWWSFSVVIISYGFIPLLELLLKGTEENFTKEEEQEEKIRPIYDYMLYLNVPIQYGLLFLYLWNIAYTDLVLYEYIGLTLSMGISCGVLGINAAHELGHRKPVYEQRMSQALLLTTLYMHFFIEHNRGHHKYVSTPKDPATSRKGEIVYTFWFRSMIMGYLSAWNLEKKRLERKNIPFFSTDNQMLMFQVVQVAFILAIGLVFSWFAALMFLAVSLIGILHLETVNYIEHYGLVRKEIRPGVYERVQPHHSWNSNHSLGRILLYELTRHSDHHFLANRKYQVLRHFDQSPQLPTGYPGMVMLSLVPPLWFAVMNKRVDALMGNSEEELREMKSLELA